MADLSELQTWLTAVNATSGFKVSWREHGCLPHVQQLTIVVHHFSRASEPVLWRELIRDRMAHRRAGSAKIRA